MKPMPFHHHDGRQAWKTRCLLGLSVAAASLPGGVALAEDKQASSSLLEEIIVSARRVEENQQNVSIAITTLTPNDLEIKNITNFEQLQYNVPALSFSHGAGRESRLQIRGQSTAKNSDFPGVDRLFSEVPLIGASGPSSATLADLESIQVLKGPQGVAFGRNSTGGAVLLYPTKPKPAFGAHLKTNIGNFDYQAIEGMINVPVIEDRLAVRALATQDKRDGWIENIHTGHDLNERDYETLRVSALFTPTDSLENLTVYSLEKSDTLGAVNSLYAYNPNGLATLLFGQTYRNLANEAIALGRDRIRIAYEGGQKREATFVANTTSFKVNDNLTLKNIFGFQELEASNGINMSGIALPLIYLGIQGSDDLPSTRMYTDEVQLLYSHPENHFDLVAGLFWSRQEPGKSGEPNEQITIGRAGPLTTTSAVSKSIAPYAQVTIPLTAWVEGLSFTTGVRWTKDQRDSRQVRTTAGVSTVTEVSGEWSDYNWEATFNYQANESLLTYLAHRHGFKGGAFNPSARDPALVMVEPEYVDDVEWGLKWDWSAGGIQGRTNVALYYQWYEDIVTNTHFIDKDGFAFTLNFNSAEATIKGGEIESTVQFTDRFSVSAHYSYVESEVKSQIGSPIPIEKLADIPRHKVSATVHYVYPLGNNAGELDVAVTGYAQSDHYADQASESEASLLPGYGVVNANAGWKNILGNPLDLTFFVNNAFDKEYYLSGADIYNNFGYVLAFWGEPRTYGVRLTYRWGE